VKLGCNLPDSTGQLSPVNNKPIRPLQSLRQSYVFEGMKKVKHSTSTIVERKVLKKLQVMKKMALKEKL
jgi:hypothetical protein